MPVKQSNEKRWFDDWLLTVAKSDDPMLSCYVEVELPNCSITELGRHRFKIHCAEYELKDTANLLDKLLSELTGTSTATIENHGQDTTMAP